MSRIFTADNAACAKVFDVEAKLELRQVMSVDVDSGQVVCAHQPLRLVGDEVDTYEIRFASIHPIYGGQLTPQLFHCYGRQ